MQNLSDKVKVTQESFQTALKDIDSLQKLDEIRIKFLGKKGFIAALMAELSATSVEEKKKNGPLLNQFKQHIEQILDQLKHEIIEKQTRSAIAKQQNFDITASKTFIPQGHIHPYTQFTEEIEDIFLSMGYEVLDGPELETDFYNFTGLNIPEDHPARDMYDTLWSNLPNYLLRTHTSPVQVRTMQAKNPPIAAIVPGRVFRHEAIDASHDYMFMQCEGFFVDKNVNLAHLFATAQTFLKTLFKQDQLDIRIRPGFFPFVEPGIEIDMRCPFCTAGCSTCKQSTWMEVFPGGLIHPNVLRTSGINPDEYSGFAFGFGLSRLAMLKYGIDDIRLFRNGKIKFLEQF